jgi:hypothetical protein
MPGAVVMAICLNDLFTGVFGLPLTVLRCVRGSWARVGGRRNRSHRPRLSPTGMPLGGTAYLIVKVPPEPADLANSGG